MLRLRFLCYSRTKRRFISIMMLMNMLWIGMANAQHAVDTLDHSHHHCQLFSQLTHGLTPSLPVCLPPEGQEAPAPVASHDAPSLASMPPQARDPPFYV